VAWAWAWACGHPNHLARIGQQARRTFETMYTADHNYDALLVIQQLLLSERR
jgi:hypothetical protein